MIESVRALGEVDFLKKQRGFRLIAIDADPKVRYERIVKRQSELDHIDFAQFKANDEREMAQSDPSSGNIAGCMKRADMLVSNDGTIRELREKLDDILRKIQLR